METPRSLFRINGETLVRRTIRLLRKAGVTDIAISSTNPIYKKLRVPVLKHRNNYKPDKNGKYYWLKCFYPIDEPVCYIFGDVYFSPRAIKTIVNTETDDIEFFASAPPFSPEYTKPYAEPFAFKVVNTKRFRRCVNKAMRLQDEGAFDRMPIAWELWQVIKDTRLNYIDYNNYVAINDYTRDLDSPEEVEEFQRILGEKHGR